MTLRSVRKVSRSTTRRFDRVGLDRPRAAEHPALRLVADDEVFQAGEGEPAAAVTATTYELVMALSGRRSPDQIRALDWEVTRRLSSTRSPITRREVRPISLASLWSRGDHDSMAEALWRCGAGELAALIREGTVSSRDVIEAHLARIEAVNPEINAVVRVLAGEARLAADAADESVRADHSLGPLHGVPFTVKENIDVAGTPTTAGVLANADAVAAVDNPLVERMRGAGAIPIGRTNLPDYALRMTTDSSLHGITRNPWDLARTAGGSSGGEAAALATGMSPIGFGNDLGGSVRSPAHCCGVASLRPTSGVIASAGSGPPLPLTLQLFATQGVMARHPADLRLGLSVVAGQHPRDPSSVPADLGGVDAGRSLRIGVLEEPPGGRTDPEIASVVRRVADTLADAGHTVVEAVPPSFERCVDLYAHLLLADLRIVAPVLNAVMGEHARKFLEHALGSISDEPDRVAWTLAMMERSTLAAEWSLWFEQHQLWLSPAWTQPAFLEGADIIDEAGALAAIEQNRTLVPANLLGLPAAVVPGGLADGMPVGVQIVGSRFTDLRCLAVAEQIERAHGSLTPIDPARPATEDAPS